MKYFIALLIFICNLAHCEAQPKRYPITIHVVSSNRSESWQRCQTLLVQIDGSYFELSGPMSRHGMLDLGAYQARLLKNEHQFDESTVIYELLLANKKTGRFLVSGQIKVGAIFIPMETEH